jgi:stage II sporulation protein D
VRPEGANVALLSPTGRKLKTFAAPLRIVPPAGGAFRLVGGPGSGTYRGALEVRPSLSGALNAINAVDLESYVRGVVAAESPASWPAQALNAQAVAARTYAITTSKGGVGWDHYPDTRSQVYRGVAAETPTTDAAVAATRREVVTYDGKPIITYFFSTSGGRTENVEFGFPGGKPHPALRSVEDPWDRVSPRHRWGPVRMTAAQAARKLRGLVKGSFRGIEVTRRGVSPRVVSAEIVGSGGRTTVSGPTLRTRFGLYDTWMYFALIDAKGNREDGGSARADDVGAGAAAARNRFIGAVSGTVGYVRRGTKLQVQRRVGRRWLTVVRTHVGRGGRYRATVARRGAYRVVVSGLTGPTVTLR